MSRDNMWEDWMEVVETTEEEKLTPEEEKWRDMMMSMTKEEALKFLGDERVPAYPGLEEMLSKRSIWARWIVEFLMEKYHLEMVRMLADNTLPAFLDQRVEEAGKLYEEMHPRLQDQMNVWQMDTMERIQAENQIRSQIMEEVKEILYKPL